jgi:hypothetical protein
MTTLDNLDTRVRIKFNRLPWNRFVGIGDSVLEGELDGPSEGWPDMGWFQPAFTDRIAEYSRAASERTV